MTAVSILDLARHAERLGYRRLWLAEHHNMAGDRLGGDGFGDPGGGL